MILIFLLSDQFKYSTHDIDATAILQNNSFVHLNDLAPQKGIQSCLDMLASEWFYPSGDSVGSPSNGIGAYSNSRFILRGPSQDCTSIQNCQTGIYKCNKSGYSALLLGVYKNDTDGKFIVITSKL